MKIRNLVLYFLTVSSLAVYSCDSNIKYELNTDKQKIKRLQSEEYESAGRPYSQAVRVGDHIYLSGVVGVRPGESSLIPGGIVPETRQAMENIKSQLASYGSSLDEVVKCLCMLGDIKDYSAMNSEYIKFFPNGKPARSTFGASLPLNAKIEIECMAIVN